MCISQYWRGGILLLVAVGSLFCGKLQGATVWGAATVGSGATQQDILMVLDDVSQKAYIQIAGPADRWFAWGYGASAMSGTYATIVSGSAGALSERVLGNHQAGTQLASSVTVLNNCVSAGRRYVRFSRPLTVAGRYSFNTSQTTLALIRAYGATAGATTLDYHSANRGSSSAARSAAPRPQFTHASMSGGVVTLAITNLLVGLTNHLETSSSLVSSNWSAPMTIWQTPPCGPALLTYMTNLTFTATNDAGFWRIRR